MNFKVTWYNWTYKVSSNLHKLGGERGRSKRRTEHRREEARVERKARVGMRRGGDQRYYYHCHLATPNKYVNYMLKTQKPMSGILCNVHSFYPTHPHHLHLSTLPFFHPPPSLSLSLYMVFNNHSTHISRFSLICHLRYPNKNHPPPQDSPSHLSLSHSSRE